DLKVQFTEDATIFSDDPKLGRAVTSHSAREAEMGDVVQYGGNEAWIEFELLTEGAIESIEIRNRMEVVECLRPYTKSDLGSRIRIVWEGSEYRGRGRQTVWDGSATLDGNAFIDPRPINFLNLDKELRQSAPGVLDWESLTTGGFSGIDTRLADPKQGTLHINTPLIQASLQVADIGLLPTLFEAGGIKRQMQVYRLPDQNQCRHYRARIKVPLHQGSDNAVYLRATTEDGFFIYSSPVYVTRDAGNN
ncbi:MAG: DUF3604 domain-containing protein, partial [Lacisediminimonas sp.]|nr:DUF3604 domain-containing protein [Lacisediminimonas sp.]